MSQIYKLSYSLEAQQWKAPQLHKQTIGGKRSPLEDLEIVHLIFIF
jgi:hypothetical protein